MKILVLGQNGDFTNIVVNRLQKEFKEVDVIIESPVDRKTFLKRRIRTLGLSKVIGQCLFMLLIQPYLQKIAKERIEKIIAKNKLDTSDAYVKENSCKVDSVNSDECRKIMKEKKPDLIVVNGTRIISKQTIQCSEVPMVNMHLGITPKYRGVHGGYWALAMGDIENCGVTIHRVDEGIDTGNIIAQTIIEVTQDDNFCTYPYLQVAAGIKLEVEVIKNYLSGELVYLNNNLQSCLWSHPTILEYIKYRKKGVK